MQSTGLFSTGGQTHIAQCYPWQEVLSLGRRSRYGILNPTTQVTVERLEAMLYTAPSPPVDLMIRTSGEKRLSDFLLWQSENAIIHFTSVLWPDFSLWHLLAAIFYYQVCHDKTCLYFCVVKISNFPSSATASRWTLPLTTSERKRHVQCTRYP